MRENKKGLSNLIKNNTFFIKSGICIVVLLLCFVTIKNYNPLKTTYSAPVAGSCPANYVLLTGDSKYDEFLKKDVVGEYCCPNGSQLDVVNGETYCVNSGYSLTDDGKLLKMNVRAEVKYLRNSAGKLAKICSDTLGNDWEKHSCNLINSREPEVTYSCKCIYKGLTNNNFSEPKMPTYSGGACFLNRNDYIWSESPTSFGNWLKTPIETSEECSAYDSKLSAENSVCYVKDDDYIWYEKDYNFFINEGYKVDDSIKNRESCLNRKLYQIRYFAGDDATNVPEDHYKNGLIPVVISPKIPEKEGAQFLYWVHNGNNKIYPGDYYDTDSNLILTAVWKYDLIKNKNDYSYENDSDLNLHYIGKVHLKTTLKDFKSNIILNEGYSFKDTESESEGEILYTGFLIDILDSESKVSDYVIVSIPGDVTGSNVDGLCDGKITSSDFVEIYHYFNKDLTLDGAYLMASDYNQDGDTNSTDFVEIYHYLKDGGK